MPTVTEAKNKEKAAQSQTQTTTTPAKPKAKTSAAKLPDFVPAWDQYAELRMLEFDKLIEERTRIYDEMKFREKKVEALDQQIQALFAVAGTEKVTWENRPVQIVHSNSGAKVSAQELLLHGVGADVIAECTVPGTPYQYVLVGKPSK